MRARRNAYPLIVIAVGTVTILIGCKADNATPAPSAASPEILTIGTGDPSGTPAPTGAPALFTTLIKFRIPSGTVFELAENGWMLRESNTAQCGDAGCYQVLDRKDDGAGKTTWIVQAWPQAYRRFANQLKYIVTDVSLNNSVTGLQLASKPETLKISPAVNGNLGGNPLPVSQAGTPEWAAFNQQEALAFRTIGLSNANDATAYYTAVDPGGQRATLDGFRTLNGFSATDDSQDEATAHYFNAGDLVLGRSMHLKTKPNGDIAYYVSNYPTVEDAVRGTNLIATVAMDYSPVATGGQRIMKFFVYGGNNSRVPSADLDGNGQKFIPNLCTVCHGLRQYNAGGSADIGARFLPFDLSSYQYGLTQGRNGQEAAFKQLNKAMLASNASQATTDLIQKWYEDLNQTPSQMARATQNDDAVPNQWNANGPLYLNVVRPGCRSCHVTRDAPLDFASFQNLNARGPRAYATICQDRAMPNAVVNQQRFWLQHLSQQAGGTMAAAMRTSGLNGWTGVCPVP